MSDLPELMGFEKWQDDMTMDMRRINEASVRLRCLALAVQTGRPSPLILAQEYYEWVSKPIPPLAPAPKFEKDESLQ